MQNFYQLYPAYPIIPNPVLSPESNYLHLFEQFSSQIHEQSKQIEELKHENFHLRSQIQQYKLYQDNQQIISDKNLSSKQSQSKIKKNKPQKTFFCDYENCNRSYSSTLALNLHIKTKHNGGTKKERDAYAKLIILAQLRGEPKPQINFTFSQNYLQKFKEKLLLEHQIQKKQNHQIPKSSNGFPFS